jgi:hypothetical protein
MSVIYILDLDGTIVGDVTDILEDYYFRVAYSEQTKNKRYLQTSKELFRKFDEGLLRPFFIDFCKYILTQPNAYVYVYTASASEWAHYLIPNIEAYVNHKIGGGGGMKKFMFQRPIFARDYCSTQTYKKCLEKIKPELKLRHKEAFRLIMVDNNVTLEGKEVKYLLVCPTYDVATPMDFMRRIEWNAFTKKVKHLSYHALPRSLSSANRMQSESYIPLYYLELYRRHKRVIKKNKKYNKDMFWKKFIVAMKALHIQNDVDSMEGTEFPMSLKKQYQLESKRDDRVEKTGSRPRTV